MTDKALTPEEARDLARWFSGEDTRPGMYSGYACAATLRAYADQADALTRLAEYEEAVGEYFKAEAEILAAFPMGDCVADNRRDAAEARLRALQEKNNE